MKTVGEVAALAGVTVRALHHYDELGLLSPSGRSEAGYRLYSHGDLARLRETCDGFDPSEYEDEARARWGHTEAYQESGRRAQEYGEAEWDEIRAESEAITRELVALMRAGRPADGPEARALAERHRGHISRWFYPCSAQMHRGPGEMYVADERFAAVYERGARLGRLLPRRHRGGGRGAGRAGQSVIAMCPGWAATRSSQARIAG